ncbi:DUF6694 family lipoprotein [Pseudomonas sp. S2_F03]
MRRMFAAGLVTLMLAGCGGPKLDGTSDESLTSSLDKVTADLPQDKKASTPGRFETHHLQQYRRGLEWPDIGGAGQK